MPSVISSYESETCKTMNLLQYKEHFMLIKNESKEKLMGKFICDKCQTSFTRMRNLNDHQKDKKCRGIHYELKEKFPKYCTNLKASLFGLYMKLVKYNLENKYDTLMTHLFTYDFESSTDRSNTKNCKKLFFEGQQVPMSFAYAYDLGYGLVSKTVLITDEEINNCPFKLVEVFVNKVIEISILSFNIYKIKYAELYNLLDNDEKFEFMKDIALPILGFNSGKFDVKLLQHFGFYQVVFRHNGWDNIQFEYKDEVSTKKLGGEEDIFLIPDKIFAKNTFRFVDQMLWTIGTLDRFIKAYNKNADIGKLVFPHSEFDIHRDSKKEFNKDNFPIEFFYNKLRCQDLEIEKYDLIFEVAKKCQVETMEQYLRLYNQCDVVPFLQACQNFRESVIEQTKAELGFSIEPYHESFGLPSMAYKILIHYTEKPYRIEHEKLWEFKG